MKNKLVVIAGPTATMKTSTAIKLAKEFNGEIINFDSLLFYRELNIGTAKPSLEEQQGIPHHLIGTNSYKDPINAADFMDMAIPIVNDCLQRGKVPFLVGGSGFYLQALLKGMFPSTTTPPEILERSEKVYQTHGITPFIEVLAQHDKLSFEHYHENDHYRIRRAVEHFWTTGEAFSEARKQMQEKLKQSPVKTYGWQVLQFYFDIPKPEHFELIQKRTEIMFEQGLIDEVKDLIAQGATGEEKPLSSIGYKEIFGLLNQEFASEEECKERISINTRRLAKAQRTWFNKVDNEKVNPVTDQEEIRLRCLEFLKS